MEPSGSPRASPVTMVQQKDGSKAEEFHVKLSPSTFSHDDKCSYHLPQILHLDSEDGDRTY
jgi:hypothetical protein